MVRRQHCQNLETEQGVVYYAPFPLVFRSDYYLRPSFLQELDRVAVKARDEIEFHVRPMLSECVHQWHQPIETSVAFQRDTQTSRGLLGQFGKAAFGRADFFQYFFGQRH